MKLSGVTKMVKRQLVCNVFHNIKSDDFYIGTASAIYCATGFPLPLNRSQMGALLGISEDTMIEKVVYNDFDCAYKSDLEGFNLDDNVKNEVEVKKMAVGMQKKDTEQILLYYGKIEKQLDSVNMELAELQDRYSPIKGLAMDGMPHGSTPGDSTASLAVKLADNEEYQNRENELIVRRVVLKSDLQEIRQKLDRLNDDYKTILKGRYVYADRSLQKTWESIAISIGKKKITAQRWKDAALVVLGGMFDEIPMIEEILSRAYDARD